MIESFISGRIKQQRQQNDGEHMDTYRLVTRTITGIFQETTSTTPPKVFGMYSPLQSPKSHHGLASQVCNKTLHKSIAYK